MRVLMLTDFYPPIIGGVEQHVRNLSHALAERGHSVAVVTLWHEGAQELEEDGLVRVYRLRGTTQRFTSLFADGGRRFAPPVPDPEIVFALRNIISREHPEIVHSHSWFGRSFLPLKRWSGARLIATLHDYGLACATKGYMVKGSICGGPHPLGCLTCAVDTYGLAKGIPIVAGSALYGPMERSATDVFLAVSQAVAEYNGLARGSTPFHIVPNFVAEAPAASNAELAPYLSQLPDTPFLLYVGALGGHKGIHTLLQAYESQPALPPLVMIGAPWHDTPASFPPNVTALKSWPRAAVLAAWERSLLGLVPSIWPEPCPTVAMEAMLKSKPLIGTSTGGLTDLIDHGRSGILVPPGNSEALASAMVQLSTDANLRTAMGAVGREKVVAFQATTVIPKIEQVYQEQLNNQDVVSASAGMRVFR